MLIEIYLYSLILDVFFCHSYIIMNKTHNLDIHMYSLQDLLNLFDLTYDIDI